MDTNCLEPLRIPPYMKELEGTPSAWSAKLRPFVLEERAQRIREVLEERSFNICTVLEHIYDLGNLSAVVRSAEAFGYPALHVIEMKNFKEPNRVSRGAGKWIEIKRWQESALCFEFLKEKEHQIAVTSMDGSDTIESIDFSQPIAFVLGSERDGVSPTALDFADYKIKLPMHGFTQSFNISVAAALGYQRIYQARVKQLGQNGDLTQEQKDLLELLYLHRTVDRPEHIIARLKQLP